MSDPALAALIDRAHARRESFNTVGVGQLPEVGALTETTVLGTYSYTLLSSKSRLIVSPLCIPLDHVIETPSAIARDYLKWKYHRSPRAKHMQIQTLMGGMRGLPGFAKPCRFDHGFYIDIRAAYWSIMTVTGWNVDYWPERWLGAGVPPYDFPFQSADLNEKKARNCLVSCGTGDQVLMYYPRRPFSENNPGPRKTRNEIMNWQLWRLVTDVLHAIGGEALNAGAVYVHTDGYIAPTPAIKDKVCQIVKDWGLNPRIDHEGAGEVYSRGTYAIGKHHPAHETAFRHSYDAVLKPRYSSWLQKSFSHFAGMLNREILLDSLIAPSVQS
jgi:hypothetical protein